MLIIEIKQKGCYDDALHRYSYTLKKFPKDPTELAVNADNVKAILEMKFNLLLNLSRCYRKLQILILLLKKLFKKILILIIIFFDSFMLAFLVNFECSIDLCTKAIELKNDSYEAFYSRARAKRDLRMYESALEDLTVADKLCYGENPDIKKLIGKIKDEHNLKDASKLYYKQRNDQYLHCAEIFDSSMIESPPLYITLSSRDIENIHQYETLFNEDE
ncbi:TANC2-like isoform X2 [Brachionus plicatilis]|uniref:TANC2-like isoform X2 n=1 Tax=Brachionus plicatilis TaxID=10195 RepID=A0A3M7PAP5_BRAPC|nr:TANC2-like isoform X2 [Brachionus plicatilis]